MAGANRSRDGRVPYLPALDGFRGLAVLAVLLFHGGFAGAKGGFLGVTAFFVLSGFLIGTLLLVEREHSGRIDLLAFWMRRARRLVPAALVLVALVIAYVAWGTDRAAGGVVGDGFASVTWVANWRFVFADRSYGDLFSDPSPFQHMWSLAVEEQFYLVLPIAAIVLLGRHGRPRRHRLARAVAVAVVASTVAAAVLHAAGSDSARTYYGTDTRAAEPLVGVMLAVALRRARGRRDRRQRFVLEIVGLVGLAGLVAMIACVDEGAVGLYRGGFLAAAAAAAAVVASATEPKTVVARALSLPPLVALGRISYGVYLYHWPVFLVFDEARTGLRSGPLFAVRAATTVALAILSYFLVEQPVRSGRIRLRVGLVGWANATVGLLAGLVLVASVGPSPSTSLLAAAPSAAAPPPPVVTTPPPTTVTVASSVTSPVITRRASRQGKAPMSVPVEPASPSRGAEPVGSAPSPGPVAEPPPPGPPALKIAVVGDSLAENLANGLKVWAASRHDAVVYDLSTPACPFSRGGTRRLPDYTEWPITAVCGWWADPGADRSRKLAEYDPDIVLMHDALNEIADRKLPEWPSFRRPGEYLFDQWLFDEYSEMAAKFAAAGAKVLALNSVCAKWRSMGESTWGNFSNGEGEYRMQALDRVTARLADEGHLTAELGKKVCPDGKFTQTVAGVDDARPDGYHLTTRAAAALADQWLGPLALSLAVP